LMDSASLPKNSSRQTNKMLVTERWASQLLQAWAPGASTWVPTAAALQIDTQHREEAERVRMLKEKASYHLPVIQGSPLFPELELLWKELWARPWLSQQLL
jgi:hypothetical protein